MAFGNPILAGTALVRQAIKSPNYVPNTAGWSINRDGTVDLQSGRFRGAVFIGTAPAPNEQIGLTGAAIPAVLLAFGDYTWHIVNAYYFNGTDFAFDALVKHNPSTALERMLGVYTPALGVQISDLQVDDGTFQRFYGSDLYNTARQVIEYRKTDVTISATATLTVAGVLSATGGTLVPSSVQNANTLGAGQTFTTAVYGNITGVSIPAFVKRIAATRILVRMLGGAWSSVGTGYQFIYGCNINGVDTDIGRYNFNTTADHRAFGSEKIITGVPAGTYVVNGRGKISGGANTANVDGSDQWAMTVEEIV